jgi:hypothetical protein
MDAPAITFSPEATAEHLRGLQASADLIGKIAAGAERTTELEDTMDRNVRHLEIMLSMSHIQAAGADLDPYQAAIVAGKGWLAAS